MLHAPKAILPELLLQSAALGVRLHPTEMNFCRIDTTSAIILLGIGRTAKAKFFRLGPANVTPNFALKFPQIHFLCVMLSSQSKLGRRIGDARVQPRTPRTQEIWGCDTHKTYISKKGTQSGHFFTSTTRPLSLLTSNKL